MPHSFPLQPERPIPPPWRLAGFHQWYDLLFVHWAVEPEPLRCLLPAGLELETWDGKARLGMVCFGIRGLRPWWFPPLPGVSAFLETNLRTYVTHSQYGPGVWFYSLDATSLLAVKVARWRWHLPYFHAQLSLCWEGNQVHYCGRRRESAAQYDVAARLLEPEQAAPGREAVPRTRDYFLVERYLLYAADDRGGLWAGCVAHAPYRLFDVELLHCRTTLPESLGLPPVNQRPDHVAFSPGVRTRVGTLQRVAQR